MLHKNLILFVILFFGFNSLVFSQIEKKIIIKKDKSENKAWLGVMLKQMNEEKVEIEKVFENSPAEKSGLLKGDIINFINEEEIKNASDVVDAVKNLTPETKIKVKILRGTAKKELSVTLGVAPISDKVLEFEMQDLDEQGSEFNWETPHKFLMKKINLCDHDKGILGLEVETLNKQFAEYFNAPDKKGVLVKFVDTSGLGAKSGFKAGDIIVKIGNDRIKNVNDITELIEDAKNGDNFLFEVLRNNTSKKLNVAIANTSSEKNCPNCNKSEDFNMQNFNFKINPKIDGHKMEKFYHKMPKPQIEKKEIKLEILEL